VARAIHRSRIPVISAVGHEPDITIADFVADLRAATPSNAAELAVPDRQEVGANLDQLALRMGRAMRHQLERYKKELSGFSSSRALAQPESMNQDRRLMLDYQAQRLSHGLRYTLSAQRERYGRMAAALDALSPFKVLGRGYAIPQHEDGAVAVSVGEFTPGDRLTLTMADGSVHCLVEESRCRSWRKKS
jgi:exodeoxyribonuclease VII large subunit